MMKEPLGRDEVSGERIVEQSGSDHGGSTRADQVGFHDM